MESGFDESRVYTVVVRACHSVLRLQRSGSADDGKHHFGRTEDGHIAASSVFSEIAVHNERQKKAPRDHDLSSHFGARNRDNEAFGTQSGHKMINLKKRGKVQSASSSSLSGSISTEPQSPINAKSGNTAKRTEKFIASHPHSPKSTRLETALGE